MGYRREIYQKEIAMAGNINPQVDRLVILIVTILLLASEIPDTVRK